MEPLKSEVLTNNEKLQSFKEEINHNQSKTKNIEYKIKNIKDKMESFESEIDTIGAFKYEVENKFKSFETLLKQSNS